MGAIIAKAWTRITNSGIGNSGQIRGTAQANPRLESRIKTSALRICDIYLGVSVLRKGSVVATTFSEKPEIEERINLQQQGDRAKPYQVRQVRAIILRHKLGGNMLC